MRLYHLREVHRPTDIDKAARLLRRKDVSTAALGGGVTLVGEGGPGVEAVVDLSRLGLERVERRGGAVHLGAMVRLQILIDDLSDVAYGLLAKAAHRTATWHLRNRATIGGALMSTEGPAPLLAALDVLDAAVVMRDPIERTISFEEFLDMREHLRANKALMTAIIIREPGQDVGHGYAQVGRTPADTPIVCVACQAGAEGEVRLAAGGVWDRVVGCQTPDDPAQAAARLTAQAGDTPRIDDYLGAADYRAAMLPVLAGRVIAQARTQIGRQGRGGGR
jgi:CO/xanthine dehydrogenase FAD-binding subunit